MPKTWNLIPSASSPLRNWIINNRCVCTKKKDVGSIFAQILGALLASAGITPPLPPILLSGYGSSPSPTTINSAHKEEEGVKKYQPLPSLTFGGSFTTSSFPGNKVFSNIAFSRSYEKIFCGMCIRENGKVYVVVSAGRAKGHRFRTVLHNDISHIPFIPWQKMQKSEIRALDCMQAIMYAAKYH